ncbi:MAG TPA: universal stress protein [Verrucomicrobiae bacterium]|nr:universal stress protein [Verrucomicrobiae bacterium]
MKTKPVKTRRGATSETGPEEVSPGKRSGTSIHLRKILVPVDFSGESKRALQYAVGFARQFGASITLLHVVEPMVYPPDAGYGPMISQVPNIGSIRKAGTRLSALGKKQVGRELLAETAVLTGSPHHEITRAARALAIDLIVMGTHGYTGLNHALMGSTAERVVRHAPCPVFVVRKGPMSLFKHG